MISVVTDLARRRILDIVTYPTMALALGVRAGLEGLGDLERGLLSGLVGTAVGAVLFALLAWRGKGFGWGDVKLMGAVGAVFGYPLILAALVFISLVGALQAMVSLLWQGAVWETIFAAAQRFAAVAKLGPALAPKTRRHIPYGLAIALGSFWAMWWERTQT